MKSIYCFALALGLPLGALGAQQSPALAAGARVRVLAPKPVCTYPEATPCYRRVIGSLESLDSATIVVQRETGETVTVSRAPGTRMEVSGGPTFCSPDRGRCVILGFMGGAGLGALVGHLSVQSQGGESACECGLVYLLTVPAGAVLGTIIGALVGGEDWERADLPARLSVGPDGTGRFAVGLSLRF